MIDVCVFCKSMVLYLYFVDVWNLLNIKMYLYLIVPHSVLFLLYGFGVLFSQFLDGVSLYFGYFYTFLLLLLFVHLFYVLIFHFLHFIYYYKFGLLLCNCCYVVPNTLPSFFIIIVEENASLITQYYLVF